MKFARSYWKDHDKIEEMSKNLEKLESESGETVKKLSEDIMSQLDTFDTALTRISIDQDAEISKLSKSHENLRRVVKGQN